MNLSRTLLARTAAGTLAGTGLVAASVVGVQSATASGTHHAATAKHGQVRCRHVGLHLAQAPEALKQDLRAARQKLRDSDATGAERRTERREALAAITKAAESGEYGEKVQQRLEKREQRVAERRAALPGKLRADLASVATMPPGDERRAAARKIREGRLDGTYGAEVKARAEQAQHRREQREQTCQERRQQRQEEKAPGSSAG